MKIWLAKRGRELIPTDEESERVISRLGDGECALVTVTRPRSVSWLRMYMGICMEIGQNQDPPRDKDSIDYELRIRAGHCFKTYIDGKLCRFPKRIAFDQLTQDEWVELWPSLELAIREEFGEEYLQLKERDHAHSDSQAA